MSKTASANFVTQRNVTALREWQTCTAILSCADVSKYSK